MPKVLLAECMQEISSFNPVPSQYENFSVRRGRDLLAQRGMNTAMGGAIEVFSDHGDVDLAPDGVRGLLVLASGRRVLKSVNINAYLTQVSEYGGFWARLAGAIRTAPHISYRIQMLWAAGFWSPEHDQNRPARESGAGEPEGLAQEKTAGA